MVIKATIFALATGRGRAGVAVIRVSGPKAADTILILTRQDLPEPRAATLRTLVDVNDKRVLDRALVLWFPGPGSFTGEDIAEFHVHGGRAVITGLTDSLAKLPGLRVAEAGEFTRRAVENSKMDLTAAEGLIDLINAETEAQRCQALRQMGGALSELYEIWRSSLLRAQAMIEVGIDFADESDVGDNVTSGVRDILYGTAKDIANHLNDAQRGERLRDGMHVAIIGAPNVGKSSLLNALVSRNVAIVSDLAGTTRDILETHLDIEGYPVTIADTAGLRDSNDVIEMEGIRRAEGRAATADLKIAMFDCTSKAPDAATMQMVDAATVVAINKLDLSMPTWDVKCLPPHARCFFISVQNNVGLDDLFVDLKQRAELMMDGHGAPVITRLRHRTALVEARDALDQTMQAMDKQLDLALVAESLRYVVRAIGRITGRVDVEDLLDSVFKDFCIGK